MKVLDLSDDENEKVIKNLTKKAEAGDVDCQLRLGVIYGEGLFGQQDDELALKFYKMGAESGSYVCQHSVGVILEEMGEYEEALKYYSLAAAQEYGLAYLALGKMYQSGHGVPVNFEMAVKFYNLAGKNGVKDVSDYIAKIEKEKNKISVSENDALLGKKIKGHVESVSDYDEDERIVHVRYSDGREAWYEYDGNGNKTLYRTNDGLIYTYEYDSKGRIIKHFSDYKGSKSVVVYDYLNDGKTRHRVFKSGKEEWFDYDDEDCWVHFKDTKGNEENGEYDSNGFYCYRKFVTYDGSVYEEFIENDSQGREVHVRKVKDGKSNGEIFYKYDFSKNGKILRKTEYQK